MVVKNEKELGREIENKTEEIEIEGDFSKKVIKIHATGKVAWAVVIGAFGIAIPLEIAALIAARKSIGSSSGVGLPGGGLPSVGLPGGNPVGKVKFALMAAPAGVIAAAPAVGVLGMGTTISALSIAIGAAGVGGISAGIAALNRLRDYDLKKIGENHIILTRK